MYALTHDIHAWIMRTRALYKFHDNDYAKRGRMAREHIAMVMRKQALMFSGFVLAHVFHDAWCADDMKYVHSCKRCVYEQKTMKSGYASCATCAHSEKPT